MTMSAVIRLARLNEHHARKLHKGEVKWLADDFILIARMFFKRFNNTELLDLITA